ncbi:unnamed protein product [Closterium sp. Naga37s-1]|nr:unnamed protein product [Closterium sp. Naga37s-1]
MTDVAFVAFGRRARAAHDRKAELRAKLYEDLSNGTLNEGSTLTPTPEEEVEVDAEEEGGEPCTIDWDNFGSIGKRAKKRSRSDSKKKSSNTKGSGSRKGKEKIPDDADEEESADSDCSGGDDEPAKRKNTGTDPWDCSDGDSGEEEDEEEDDEDEEVDGCATWACQWSWWRATSGRGGRVLLPAFPYSPTPAPPIPPFSAVPSQQVRNLGMPVELAARYFREGRTSPAPCIPLLPHSRTPHPPLLRRLITTGAQPGEPVELAARYFKEGVDEVAFLNITGCRDFSLGDLPMLVVSAKGLRVRVLRAAVCSELLCAPSCCVLRVAVCSELLCACLLLCACTG